MDNWRYCTYGCGNCKIDIYDDRAKRIHPGNVLEWAHNAIDLIEHSLKEPKGIPLKYYVTCTYDAVFSEFITPVNDGVYLKSKKFRNDFIQQTISGISCGMIHYSLTRRQWTRANTLNSLILSIHDLRFFKQSMVSTKSFSVIHKALSEIPIATSCPHPRTQKAIRQRTKQYKK